MTQKGDKKEIDIQDSSNADCKRYVPALLVALYYVHLLLFLADGVYQKQRKKARLHRRRAS